MFDIKSVLDLHDRVLAQYGGAAGVRDSNLLDSALNRPLQTFGGEDLYPEYFTKKAAEVIHSVILNHPFADGNKRTAFLLCETLLLGNYVEIKAMENDCYDFVIKISTGELSLEDIVLWLQQNTQPISL